MSPRFAVLVPARLDSIRLPCKGLKRLGSLPVIGHVLERSNQIKYIKDVLLTTTNRSIDDPLVAYAKTVLKVSVYRGELNDVAKRFLNCAEKYDIDYIIRVNGDCPFIDPDLITEGIKICIDGGYEFVTNIPERTYPYGISVEIFRTSTLRKLLPPKNFMEDREHVTPCLYKNLDKIHHYIMKSNKPDLKKARLVVDTEDDLIICRKICETFGSNIHKSRYKTLAEEYFKLVSRIDGRKFDYTI